MPTRFTLLGILAGLSVAAHAAAAGAAGKWYYTTYRGQPALVVTFPLGSQGPLALDGIDGTIQSCWNGNTCRIVLARWPTADSWSVAFGNTTFRPARGGRWFVNPAVTPDPVSMALVASSLAAIVVADSRRRRKTMG